VTAEGRGRRRLNRLLRQWVVPAAITAALLAALDQAKLRSTWSGWALKELFARVTSSAPRPDPRLVLVELDDATLDDLRLPKWGPEMLARRAHRKVVQQISRAGAAAIGVDLYFDQPSDNPFEDLELAQAMEEAGNVVLTLAAVPNADQHKAPRFSDPPDAYTARKITLASPLVRRRAETQHDWGIELDPMGDAGPIPAFAQALDEIYRAKRGEFGNRSVNVLGKEIMAIRWPARPLERAFTRVSYREIWDGSWPAAHPGALADRIVLVGRTSGTATEDTHRTPRGDVPGLYVHACALQTMLDGSYPRPLVENYRWAVDFALAALAFCIVTLLAYRGSAGSAVAAAGAVCLGAWLPSLAMLARTPSIWIDPMVPSLTALVAVVVRVAWQRELSRGALQRFAGRRAAERLVAEGETGQQEVEATVLFSDVRSYTTLAEQCTPQELLATLNQHFGWMQRVIHRHGGEVNKHTGDALMALFERQRGKPPGEHARRALAAARELLETAHERPGRAGDLQFGLGLHSGPVALGALGTQRQEYGAIGDTVNVAARLEAATKELGVRILASGATAELAGDARSLRPLGAIALKGKTIDVTAYTLEE
jgi:adenylate cyclase